MPAEWEYQSLIQLTFPSLHSDWKDNFPEVIQCYIDIIAAITPFQKILLLCQQIKTAKKIIPFGLHQQIIWQEIPTNDTWCRDYGGITVLINQKRTLLDFTFNGWGNKFTSTLDNQSNIKIFKTNTLNKYAYKKIDFVLEGGSIESNGNGILLTTSQCLLHPNRNPHYSKKQITSLLQSELGAQKVLWLNSKQLHGDDTDGHIDTLARFLSPNAILCQQSKDSTNPNYDNLLLTQKELATFKNNAGKPFSIHTIPLPDPIYNEASQSLPATYLNFLFINKAILVPQYNQVHDKKVIQFFTAFFPKKEIIGINCVPLIQQGGAIHCASMQYY